MQGIIKVVTLEDVAKYANLELDFGEIQRKLEREEGFFLLGLTLKHCLLFYDDSGKGYRMTVRFDGDDQSAGGIAGSEDLFPDETQGLMNLKVGAGNYLSQDDFVSDDTTPYLMLTQRGLRTKVNRILEGEGWKVEPVDQLKSVTQFQGESLVGQTIVLPGEVGQYSLCKVIRYDPIDKKAPYVLRWAREGAKEFRIDHAGMKGLFMAKGG